MSEKMLALLNKELKQLNTEVFKEAGQLPNDIETKYRVSNEDIDTTDIAIATNGRIIVLKIDNVTVLWNDKINKATIIEIARKISDKVSWLYK